MVVGLENADPVLLDHGLLRQENVKLLHALITVLVIQIVNAFLDLLESLCGSKETSRGLVLHVHKGLFKVLIHRAVTKLLVLPTLSKRGERMGN